MSKKRIRIGGIGTGVIFNHAHMGGLLKSPYTDIVGIYDHNPEHAANTREHYKNMVAKLKEEGRLKEGTPEDIKICSSSKELYELCDAVTICTHPRYHAVYAVEAMQNGRHAMTEKAMCRNWIEADLMEKTVKETGMIYQLNDDNVSLNRFRRLRNIIESGMLGAVQHAWIARGGGGVEGPVFGRWFYESRQEAGGGCILDYGSHALSALWFALGFDKVPAEIQSLGIRNRFVTRNIGGKLGLSQNDDNAKFKVRFIDPKTGDWCTAFLESTWSTPDWGGKGGDINGWLEVTCTDGTIIAANDPENGKDYFILRHRSFGDRKVTYNYEAGEESSFVAQVTNFGMCVQENTQPYLSVVEGKKIMSVLNAAQLSEARGRINVTVADLEQLAADIQKDEKDVWKAADKMTEILTAYNARNA